MNPKQRALAAALSISAGVLVTTAVHEGYRDEAYPDPASGGAPWTIGFGETKGVRKGDRTTPLRALQQLDKSLAEYGAGVSRCITVPLSQGEFDASVDLAYNIGVAAFCRSSIVERFNAGDYLGGCMAFLLYTKARVNGKLVELRGLVTRRKANLKTCLEG